MPKHSPVLRRTQSKRKRKTTKKVIGLEDRSVVHLCSHPALDEQTIRSLIKSAQQGNIEDRNKIVTHHIRLIVWVANSIVNHRFTLGDAVSSGTLGLIRAIETFDLNKETKFSTYAVWWIRSFLGKEIDASRGNAVTVTYSGFEAARKKWNGEVLSKSHNEMADKASAALTGYSEITSLPSDLVPGCDPTQDSSSLFTEEQKELVFRCIDKLSKPRRDILRAKFGIGGSSELRTSKELAEMFQIKPRSAQVRVERALRRLKALVAKESSKCDD